MLLLHLSEHLLTLLRVSQSFDSRRMIKEEARFTAQLLRTKGGHRQDLYGLFERSLDCVSISSLDNCCWNLALKMEWGLRIRP